MNDQHDTQTTTTTQTLTGARDRSRAFRLAALLALGAASITGCASPGGVHDEPRSFAGDVGGIRLALTTTTTDGKQYRLRNAVFTIRDVWGGVVASMDGSVQDSIELTLPAGSYLISIEGPLSVQEVLAPGVELPVDVVLRSANPMPVYVTPGDVSAAVFEFNTIGGSLQFGEGTVDVGFTVTPALYSAVLPFETSGLILSSGEVVERLPFDPADPSDLYVAYNGNAIPHGVVLQNDLRGVQIAFLSGVPFGAVTNATALATPFGPGVFDQPFGPADTIMIRTPEGAVYKLGNPVEDEATNTIRFDVLQLM